MKKHILTILVLTLALLASVCFAEEATGNYSIYNTTGENLTELYIYPTGSEDKGPNLAEAFVDGAAIPYTGDPSTPLTLEFTTESGYNAKFTTLAIEEAPISLLAVDAVTGATPISFTAPQATGVYRIFNTTGENLTELYLYPTGSEDKGENLLTENFRDGAQITYTGEPATVLTLEFTTESGYNANFTTLGIEEAPITLLKIDATTGATPISFFAPQGTGVYTIYNQTGEKLTELYIYKPSNDETLPADKGENYAEKFEDGMEISYTGDIDSMLTVEFATESGYSGRFTTLGIEEAPITLLKIDTTTGATPISFSAPEK